MATQIVKFCVSCGVPKAFDYVAIESTNTFRATCTDCDEVTIDRPAATARHPLARTTDLSGLTLSGRPDDEEGLEVMKP